MNFLAHLYLSGVDPEIRLGNFIGDFVKGRNPQDRFSEKIAAGVLMHRRIDERTDHHPAVRESKQRLREKHRHYSGVIVDIFYDHFLAIHWNEHHPEPLDQYASGFYAYANARQTELPERAAWVLKHMIQGDWLTSYQSIEGIDRVLRGMARRTSFPSGMEYAADALNEHYKDFEAEFRVLFHDLKSEFPDIPASAPAKNPVSN